MGNRERKKYKVMKNILITGGAGFIGSHLVRLMVNKYPASKRNTASSDITHTNQSGGKAKKRSLRLTAATKA